jgi:hypothetical protein
LAWRLLYALDDAQRRDLDWGDPVNHDLVISICRRLGVRSPLLTWQRAQ